MFVVISQNVNADVNTFLKTHKLHFLCPTSKKKMASRMNHLLQLWHRIIDSGNCLGSHDNIRLTQPAFWIVGKQRDWDGYLGKPPPWDLGLLWGPVGVRRFTCIRPRIASICVGCWIQGHLFALEKVLGLCKSLHAQFDSISFVNEVFILLVKDYDNSIFEQ